MNARVVTAPRPRDWIAPRADDGAPWGWGPCAISEDGRHRYTLARVYRDGSAWQECSRRLLFIMLNPSTADDRFSDPTITRCQGFSAAWGYDRFAVVNLFSFRSPKPADLIDVPDAEGDPENLTTILQLALDAHRIVCAWGASGGRRVIARERVVLDMLGAQDLKLHHLGLTKGGSPKHPLYLLGSTRPTVWDL